MDKKLLDIKELSSYTGFPEWTIRKLVCERGIPVTRVNRRIYFDKAKIDKWLENNTTDSFETYQNGYLGHANGNSKTRDKLDDNSKSQLKSSSMKRRKEAWKRWDKGIFVRGESVYISYYLNGGKIRELLGPVSSVSRTIAKQARSVRIAEIAQGKFKLEQIKKAPTIGSFSEDYLKYVKLHNKSWKRSKEHIDHFKKYFGANTKLSFITNTHIEGYKAHRLEEVKPSTINRELACLKHFFNMAIEWNKAIKNPVKGVKFFKEKEQKEFILSLEQEEKLLEASAHYLRNMIATALNTVMRLNELV